MNKRRYLYDQIICIGDEKIGQSLSDIKENLWEMTGSIFSYQQKDEMELWNKHIFADTNGWIICVENPVVVKYYLKQITKQRGQHWIVLLTTYINSEILHEFACKENIVIYNDILYGQPTMEFVHELTEAAMLFSNYEDVKLLISEKQCSLFGMHTQYLTYMGRLAQHYGIKNITLRSDVTDEPEHVSYTFFMDNSRGEMIAHGSATIDSNLIFILDVIDCLYSIADKYPATANVVLGNSHRFAWFPSIKGV